MTAKKYSLLRDIKLNWWQTGFFKTAAVSFGILLGLYFGDLLSQYIALFWLTFIVPGLYIIYIYLKKK